MQRARRRDCCPYGSGGVASDTVPLTSSARQQIFLRNHPCDELTVLFTCDQALPTTTWSLLPSKEKPGEPLPVYPHPTGLGLRAR